MESKIIFLPAKFLQQCTQQLNKLEHIRSIQFRPRKIEKLMYRRECPKTPKRTLNDAKISPSVHYRNRTLFQ